MTTKQPRAEDKIYSMLLTLIDKRDSFCNGTIPYKEYREYFDEVVRKVAARDQEWQDKLERVRIWLHGWGEDNREVDKFIDTLVKDYEKSE